nr:unnamed protein product [Callosobruchus analis]
MEEGSGGINRVFSTTTINNAEASNESMKERCLKLEKELSHQLSRRDEERKTIEELTQLVAAQQQQITEEEDVPRHTFPLPSEKNIHAVIRGIPTTLKEAEIKEELQQRGYAPLHII